MEALEQQGNLLRRDGGAVVADGDNGLFVVGGQPQIQRGMGRGELGGVFQQVVDHLRDEIPVALHHGGVVGNVGLYVQSPVVDLLLHAEKGDTHDLADIEVLLLHLLGLDLGDIQHAAHQTAQTAALVRDDLQIVPLPLRRDGAVQNTVGVAGDGGHGGFQLVGHVGDEVPALALRLRQ